MDDRPRRRIAGSTALIRLVAPITTTPLRRALVASHRHPILLLQVKKRKLHSLWSAKTSIFWYQGIAAKDKPPARTGSARTTVTDRPVLRGRTSCRFIPTAGIGRLPPDLQLGSIICSTRFICPRPGKVSARSGPTLLTDLPSILVNIRVMPLRHRCPATRHAAKQRNRSFASAPFGSRASAIRWTALGQVPQFTLYPVIQSPNADLPLSRLYFESRGGPVPSRRLGASICVRTNTNIPPRFVSGISRPAGFDCPTRAHRK